MTTKSKVASATPSARTRRKTKTVSTPQPIHLTREMIRAQGWKAYHEYMSNLTRAEMKVVGHLLPLTFPTPQDVVKEARRLLGESIAKCKVIRFPAPTRTKLDRHNLEFTESFDRPQGPELAVVCNREQGCMNHENTAHDGLINESSESKLKRSVEIGLDDSIH